MHFSSARCNYALLQRGVLVNNFCQLRIVFIFLPIPFRHVWPAVMNKLGDQGDCCSDVSIVTFVNCVFWHVFLKQYIHVCFHSCCDFIFFSFLLKNSFNEHKS